MYALKERIEKVLVNYLFQESDGEHKTRTPRVWLQHLPEKLWDETVDPADYPFVQLVMSGGTVNGTDAGLPEGSCDISIMVGGYDDGIEIDGKVRDQQGWLIPAEIMWRIISELETGPRVGKMYDLQHPITWELPAEQPAPLWYGLINTIWTVPVIRQEFGQDFWGQNRILPHKGPHIEKVYT